MTKPPETQTKEEAHRLQLQQPDGLPSYAELVERNEALERYVTYLEAEVGIVRSQTDPVLIAKNHQLSPTQAMLAIVLANAHPRPASSKMLRAHFGPMGQAKSSKSLQVQIYKLRERLGQDAIVNEYGVGYSMSAAAAAKILVTLHLSDWQNGE